MICLLAQLEDASVSVESVMSSAKPSTAEEKAFMANLLANPPVTPTKHRGLSSHSHRPNLGPQNSGPRTTFTPKHQLYSVGQVNLEEETSGWDWDALSDYVPSPKKLCNSSTNSMRADFGHPASPSVVPKYTPDPCTRCMVQTVTDTWNDGVREKVSLPPCALRTL